MNNETVTSAILWVVAIGVVAYLFKGNEFTAIAVILLAILGFVDVILSQAVFKKKL